MFKHVCANTGIYTHGHRNKWWCLMVECIVLPHSALIAIDRGTGSSGCGRAVRALTHIYDMCFAFIVLISFASITPCLP